MPAPRIFTEVLRDLERERNGSEAKYEHMLNGIYAKSPRLKEIDSSLAAHSITAARLILGGGGDIAGGASALKEKTSALVAEKKALLAEIGVNENWADSAYKCKKCKDTGFIEGKRCKCLIKRLTDRYTHISNLESVLKRENFDMFDLSYYPDEPDKKGGVSPRANIEKNWKLCLNFVKRFGSEFENLMLYGETGLGKTFLCNCIAKELLDSGKSVVYVTAGKLCKQIEEFRFNRKDGDEPDFYLDLVTGCDLLIIDDLGTEVPTVVTTSELFSILNGRLLARKPTIISTNLAPHLLEDTYSDRITSRLMGNYTLLRFIGKDIRLAKKYGM